jgi:hypothetical protein
LDCEQHFVSFFVFLQLAEFVWQGSFDEVVQLDEFTLNDLAVADDAVQRGHLFVTVVCFNGLLVHVVALLLDVLDDWANVSHHKHLSNVAFVFLNLFWHGYKTQFKLKVERVFLIVAAVFDWAIWLGLVVFFVGHGVLVVEELRLLPHERQLKGGILSFLLFGLLVNVLEVVPNTLLSALQKHLEDVDDWEALFFLVER